VRRLRISHVRGPVQGDLQEMRVRPRLLGSIGGANRNLRRVARRAIGLEMFLIVGLAFIFVMEFGTDLVSIAVNLAVSLLVGFPSIFALMLAEDAIRTRWAIRHRGPDRNTPPRGVEVRPDGSSQYSGRPWRQFIGIAAFFLFVTSLAFIATPIGVRDQPILAYLRWVLLAVVVLGGGVAAAALYRPRMFVVDEAGLRCLGRVWSNFDIPWNQVARIARPRLPRVLEGLVALESRGIPVTLLVVGTNGRVLGSFIPEVECGRAAGEWILRAILDAAARHGVPVMDVIGRFKSDGTVPR